MTDNLYVLEGWVLSRIEGLHAAAARERLLAARPARAPLLRRALSAVRDLARLGHELGSAQPSR